MLQQKTRAFFCAATGDGNAKNATLPACALANIASKHYEYTESWKNNVYAQILFLYFFLLMTFELIFHEVRWSMTVRHIFLSTTSYSWKVPPANLSYKSSSV